MHCYHEFKCRYLKTLKLFSIRVKELFERYLAYSVVKEKKIRPVFALFKGGGNYTLLLSNFVLDIIFHQILLKYIKVYIFRKGFYKELIGNV